MGSRIWRFQAEVEVEAETSREAQKAIQKLMRSASLEEIESHGILLYITDWQHAQEVFFQGDRPSPPPHNTDCL